MPPTQTHLRAYYNAIDALQAEEETLLAKAHAQKPGPLVHRFRESLKTLEGHADLQGEDFYEGGRKDPTQHSVPTESIVTTFDFACNLADASPREVESATELAFHYVDRELFLLRTKEPEKVDDRVEARKLDLLLASQDGLPILAELKIRDDRLPYFALVQLLMYASEAVSSTQRERLRATHQEEGFRWAVDGPFVDLYVIGFEPDEGATFYKDSLQATKRISEQLVEASAVAGFVRRIAYLEAVPEDHGLVFRKVFAFGPGS